MLLHTTMMIITGYKHSKENPPYLSRPSMQTIVRRGEKVPEGQAGTPIIVCTRNDDLGSVVQATPENRRKGGCLLQ